MGYFSNGTEGQIYAERWCRRCVHDAGDCAVWGAHFVHNYDQNGNEALASVLDMLIPRSDDGIGNDRCAMFELDEALWDGSQDPDRERERGECRPQDCFALWGPDRGIEQVPIYGVFHPGAPLRTLLERNAQSPFRVRVPALFGKRETAAHVAAVLWPDEATRPAVVAAQAVVTRGGDLRATDLPPKRSLDQAKDAAGAECSS